jgi:uncharacterized membrane protein YfcA
MPTDPLFYIVGLFAVFVMAVGRGAFGGGFAVLGVPVLALVVDPITASIIMAPVASASDPFTIWAHPPRNWSWPDLIWLIPGMVIGLALGAMFFVWLDPRIVAVAIAVVTLWFVARWFLSGRPTPTPGSGSPVQPVKAVACAAASGFTTFIAHAGNPPVAYYLLSRALPASGYVGTLIATFLVANTVKLFMYGWLFRDRPEVFVMALTLMPALPAGVWLGKRLHDRLDARRLYLLLYTLLGVTGLKLLVDSLLRLTA